MLLRLRAPVLSAALLLCTCVCVCVREREREREGGRERGRERERERERVCVCVREREKEKERERERERERDRTDVIRCSAPSLSSCASLPSSLPLSPLSVKTGLNSCRYIVLSVREQIL
jgi:hypothetical protein